MIVPVELTCEEVNRLLQEIEFCDSVYIVEFIQKLLSKTTYVANDVKNEAENILKVVLIKN